VWPMISSLGQSPGGNWRLRALMMVRLTTVRFRTPQFPAKTWFRLDRDHANGRVATIYAVAQISPVLVEHGPALMPIGLGGLLILCAAPGEDDARL
jgi:hypothetical protein